MALDLSQVVEQISAMASRLSAGRDEKRARLEAALVTLRSHAAGAEGLRRKVEESRTTTTWLVAGLTPEGLAFDIEAPPAPPSYLALATDGSHIDVDRHQAASCYLINIGRVSLRYGPSPDAVLDSEPRLYFGDRETVLSPRPGEEGFRLEGAILGVKRSIEECRSLAGMVGRAASDVPVLALLDGSLILWELEGQRYPEFVARSLIDRALLPGFDEIRNVADSRPVAFASYISSPRSTDVVNCLRVALCPYSPADCDRYCGGRDKEDKACARVAGLTDSDLFRGLLGQGRRSAVFLSHSRVVDRRYGPHRVFFFYLNVGEEVARLEVPQWVAERNDLLPLLQSLVLDQCRKGEGYPIALSEAHQQAVVTEADRQRFWRLVGLELEEEDMEPRTSAKSWSKRRPGV